MSLAKVEKVQLIVHAGVRMDVLSSLQEAGVLQLEEVDHEKFGLEVSHPEVADLEHTLFRIRHALDYFSQWEEKGFLKKLFSPKPQLPLEKKSEVLSYDFSPVLDEFEKLEQEKNKLQSEIKFLERERDFLAPFTDLTLPVSQIKPTESTHLILGSIPLFQLNNLRAMAEEEAVWFHIIQRTKREMYILLFCLQEEKARLESLLKEMGFNQAYFTESIVQKAGTEDRIEDLLERIEGEIEEKKREAEDVESARKKLAVHREKLMLIHDILTNERKKLLSASLLGETEQSIYIEGWIRSQDKERLMSKLASFLDEIQAYFRPPLPEEEPPSILDNPKPGRPFEVLTKLYGLPQRGTLDPTLFLAPFFFVFVGLCVSEAGYGLVVTLLSLLYIKFGKPKGGLLQFVTLLTFLGISTVIFGTLLGGWFGFPLRKLMILDTLQDPFSFLIIALSLGFIQVWFGTLLKMIQGIKTKNYLDAFFVQGGWMLLLPSLVLIFLTKQRVWNFLALGGAAGIVFFASPSRNPISRFFGGLYSLYDISRYLSDILSYSRLLALGLATTVIAMVVNTLCQTVVSIPVVGWLFAALIFIGGHLFNLAISFLGGFVHSMRLQFVEFFSKFFISGGKPFEPFEMESKYVEFI